MNNLKMTERGVLCLTPIGAGDVSDDIYNEVRRHLRTVPPKVRVRVSVWKWLRQAFDDLPPLTKTIGAHLYRNGAINQRIAVEAYRCRSVSSRISELRRVGWVIRKDWYKDTFGQKFVMYVFKGFQGGPNV